MTQRLPIPGGDNGDWGDILNGFLEVSHNSDGSLQTIALSAAGSVINGGTVSTLYAPTDTVPSSPPAGSYQFGANPTAATIGAAPADTNQLLFRANMPLSGLAYQGSWLPSTQYLQNDVVFYNNGSGTEAWVANTAFTSGSTFNASNWTAWPAGSGGGGSSYPNMVTMDTGPYGYAGLVYGTTLPTTTPLLTSVGYKNHGRAAVIVNNGTMNTAPIVFPAPGSNGGVSTAFTIEISAKRSRTATSETMIAKWNPAGTSSQNFTLGFNASDQLTFSAQGTSSTFTITSGSTITDTTYFHNYAVVWDGSNTVYLFANNSIFYDTTGLTALQTPDFVTPLTIGARADGSNPFVGTLGDVRVSNIARWTSAYTTGSSNNPPNPVPTSDANTILLARLEAIVPSN